MNLKGKKMLVALIHHRPHDMAKFEKKKRRGEQKTNNETSVTLRFRQTASKLWAPWVDTSIEHHFFEKRPLKLANPVKLLSSRAWMIQWTSHRSLVFVPFLMGLSRKKNGPRTMDFFAPQTEVVFPDAGSQGPQTSLTSSHSSHLTQPESNVHVPSYCHHQRYKPLNGSINDGVLSC